MEEPYTSKKKEQQTVVIRQIVKRISEAIQYNCKMNTDLESIVKMSFSATAGQNLSLDDVLLARELLRDGLGIGGVRSHAELLNSDIEVLKTRKRSKLSSTKGLLLTWRWKQEDITRRSQVRISRESFPAL